MFSIVHSPVLFSLLGKARLLKRVSFGAKNLQFSANKSSPLLHGRFIGLMSISNFCLLPSTKLLSIIRDHRVSTPKFEDDHGPHPR